MLALEDCLVIEDIEEDEEDIEDVALLESVEPTAADTGVGLAAG